MTSKLSTYDGLNKKFSSTIGEFSAVMDAIDYGILFMDSNLNMRIANKAFQKMWGFTDEFIASRPTLVDFLNFNRGNNLYDVSEDEFDKYIEQRVHDVRKGEIAPTEFALLNGKIYRYQCYALEDGGRMLTYVDITELKKHEKELLESQDKFRSIFDHGIGGIAVSATDGKIMHANRVWEDILGYSLEELEQMTPQNLTHPEDLEESSLLYQKLIDGKIPSYQIEKRYISKSGEVIWVIVGVSSVKDKAGEILYTVGEFVNITERKIAEEELRKAHDQLELRVHERTEQLRGEVEERKRIEADLLEANKFAENSNRAKSDLLANMSHELRTPLNAIIGFSDTIRAETFGPLNNDKYREYLDDIHYSGQHLLELINDILDASAIEAGALDLREKKLDLEDIVDTSIRLIMPRAREGKISLSSSINSTYPRILADERRVKQIFLNLLSNGVKFTPEGGEIYVDAVVNKDGSLGISITDTGVGMDNEEAIHALRKFGQIESGLDRKHEGTGLGLPLTKGLMELHDGTLEIDSKKGRGTKITITFPRTRVLSTIQWST
ncbi:MAG: PAS domain S-box protein [Alphaproteobacteria bacterium]|nr:PAS domain S-box protein [Rhodospirillales bacterium]MCW9045136.1 PAS domain S-box protein [Alphaproteobacteria bacterium]